MGNMPLVVSNLISGASEWVEFDDQEAVATAVGYLLGCGHGHNFIVTSDRLSICMTPDALECLRISLPNKTLRRR